MVAAAYQHRSTRIVHEASGIHVLRGDSIVGRIARNEAAGAYRYFPGADNDVAFVFEHSSLAMLLRLIETRSWEAELQRIGQAEAS